MKMPLLSICIATYNRAGFIGETLESIIPQLENDVELLIVDGASADNTEAIVQKYAHQVENIKYIRLPEKGGVDHDFDKAVQLASGEFCWLFTDDDLIKQGAIKAVKTAIGQGYGLIVVNAELRDKVLTTLVRTQQIRLQEDKIYGPSEMEQLFKDAMLYLSFIGAVVIRRSIWLQRKRETYFGTEFVHIGVIFQERLLEPVKIIANPYIIIRLGNAQWMPRSFNIWMFNWPNLVWSFSHITQEVKECVCKRYPWKDIKVLASQRSAGSYCLSTYQKHLSDKKVNIFWKLCAIFVACSPRPMWIGIHYIHSRMKSAEARAFFDARFLK